MQKPSSAESPAQDVSGKLDGRVAIVIAGTRGLGFAIAKRLAQDGAHVVVSSRQQTNVEKAMRELQQLGLKASGFVCDVGNDDDRKELLRNTESRFGGVDILVQNAGVPPFFGDILDTPVSAIDKFYDIHIKANVQIVQEVVPYMKKRKENNPAILLTSSSTGHRSEVFPGVYAITKASIYSMVRAFMPSLTSHNIRINCLSFGGFDTDFLSPVKNDESTRDRLLSTIPMRRFGNPDECAAMASLLCSDDGSYITGETITVAGGFFAGN